MPKRLFLTGRNGFVGRHVALALANPEAAGLAAGAVSIVGPDRYIDLRDESALRGAIEDARPDWVIHLAAQSFVPQSFSDPRATFDVNFFGTLALLQSLAAAKFGGRLLFVGSGDQYGLVPETELPVREMQPLKPRNPYAVSKVAAEALCYQWSQTGPFEVVMARPFNHIGPGQSEQFAVSDFARQVAEIKLARRPGVVETGDIDVTRDFTDVRDVVRAYLLLLAGGRVNGEVYNVCSGVERTPRELIERLAALAAVDITIRQDPARLRRAEQRRVCGSHTKIRDAVGWTPILGIDDSLHSILNHWTEELS